MNTKEGEEWVRFRSAALGKLRRPTSSTYVEPLLCLLEMPSFGDWTSIQVTSAGEMAQASSATIAIWRVTQDMEIFQSPVNRMRYLAGLPEPSVHHYTLETDLAARMLEQLTKIEIPLAMKDPNIVLDGVQYELSMHTEYLNGTFRWNSTSPAITPLSEWAALWCETWRKARQS